MRRKVSTLLEDALYRQAKLESVRQGKQLSEIFGEAVAAYLDEHGGGPRPRVGVALASFGALSLRPDLVRQVLEEEDGLLDA
jgi:hypothetical protein